MAQAPDIPKIKRNLARMIDAGAPETDLDEYIKSEGVTLDEVRGVGVAGATELRNAPGAVEAIGMSLLEGVPGAARMGGGMLGMAAGGGVGLAGGPAAPATVPAGAITGAVLLAEVFGQAADLAVDYVKRKVSESKGMAPAPWKGGPERAGEALMNMAIDGTMVGGGGEVSYLFRKAPNAARNLLRNKRAVEVGEDLAEAGISKEGAGLLVGSRTTQGLIELQRGLPITSDIHQKAIQSTLDDIARYADDVARSGGGTAQTAYRAGEGVRAGAQAFSEHIDEMAKVRYGIVRTGGQAGRLDDMPVNWTKAQEAAAQVRDEIVQAGGKPPDWLNKMVDDRPQQITFKEARLRVSRLARISRNITEEAAGESQNAAKRISPKIFDAMEETGKTLDPKQLELFTNTNAWYKQSIQRVKELDDIINGKTGIDAWRAATDATNRDPAKLMQLKSALKPSEWMEYVSARIADMGKEAKGQGTGMDLDFNAERFLSAYRDIIPEVKDVLFGKKTPLREGADRLARFGARIREARSMANPSGTGSKVGTYLMIAGFGGSMAAAGNGDYWPLAAFAGIVSGNTLVAKKVLTNPRFVNWLADAGVVSPANYKGVAAQITRLAGIAKDDPEARPYIQQYLQGMSEWMARKAVVAVGSGKAGDETAQAQSRKPLAQKFSEAAAPLAEQRAALDRLQETDREAWRKSMRNENAVMRFFKRTERDVAQIDVRLTELQSNPKIRNASSERGRMERVRARLMNEALDFQKAVYGG